jgi:cbb3-type cytochrome oxidase maturation protein
LAIAATLGYIESWGPFDGRIYRPRKHCSLEGGDLAPDKHATIVKLLTEEEDKLSHYQEELEFAESRVDNGRGMLRQLRHVLALMLGAIGLMGFLWSLKSGQYDDLDAAAWRAIMDDEPEHLSKS